MYAIKDSEYERVWGVTNSLKAAKAFVEDLEFIHNRFDFYYEEIELDYNGRAVFYTDDGEML